MQKEQLETILHHSNWDIINFECIDTVSDELLQILKESYPDIGIVYKEDALYDSFTVISYLTCFAQISKHKNAMKEIIEIMNLKELLHVKIKNLSYSQKRRVSFAREFIIDSAVLFIQEPLLNLDDESMRCIMESIEILNHDKKLLITTSISLKHVCLLPGVQYLIDKNGFHLLNNSVKEESTHVEQNRQFNKISAKFKDKILLFHPNEIDYIESSQGKSLLNVRKSTFQCSLSLDELEARLTQFGFYRCHRSYLVNMQKVQEIVKWTRNSYSLKLEDMKDVNIPLSKGRIDELKELYLH